MNLGGDTKIDPQADLAEHIVDHGAWWAIRTVGAQARVPGPVASSCGSWAGGA